MELPNAVAICMFHRVSVSRVTESCVAEVAMAEALARNGGSGEDRSTLTQQSIVDFLSTALEPQDDGSYLKDLYQVLQSAYANDEDQDRFKAKVENLQGYLQAMGASAASSTILLTVPAGRLDEFYIAPWQLGIDPATSVKGQA